MPNTPIFTDGFPKKFEKKIKIKHSIFESRNIKNVNKKYWRRKVDDLVDASFKPTDELESAAIADVLPRKTYELVCEILKYPVKSKHEKRHGAAVSATQSKQMRTKWKLPLLTHRTVMPIYRDINSDTDVDVSTSDVEESRVEHSNPHYDFLRKSEREQVTWPSKYLPPEKEEDKSLIKRANDLTDRIAAEFCDYMLHLGGNQRSELFTPDAIKELFQVEFDTHAARSLRVISKECYTVPDNVARHTKYINRSRKNILAKLIEQDIQAEKKPNKTTAFGRSLPRDQQWHALPTTTHNNWRGTSHIPYELTTLKAVWENILNLRSVKEYCKWVIEHPGVKRPPFLDEIGMFNLDNLNARLTLESHQVNLSENDISCESSEAVPIDDLKKQLVLCTEIKDSKDEC